MKPVALHARLPVSVALQDASLAPAQHRLHDQNAPQSLYNWLSAPLRQLQSPESPQHIVLL